MSTKIETTRRLLEMQGFYGVKDEDLAAVDLGLRVSPAICATIVAIATYTANVNLFLGLLPFAVLGAVLPGHPFDIVYNYGIRYLVRGPRLPRYRFPRRFACLLASVFIATAAWCIQAGAVYTGQVVGTALALTALVPVLTGFCVPSFLLGLFTGKPMPGLAAKE